MIRYSYGFFFENVEFVKKVEDVGIVFIGFCFEIIDVFGDKIKVWIFVIKIGVFVVFGIFGFVEFYDKVVVFIEKYGFFVIIKVVMGGGGWGMWVVRD